MDSEGSGVGVGIVHVQGAVENLNFPFLSPLVLFYITVYAAHDRLEVFVLAKAASGRDVNSAPRTLLLPYAQAFLETFGTESMKALHSLSVFTKVQYKIGFRTYLSSSFLRKAINPPYFIILH